MRREIGRALLSALCFLCLACLLGGAVLGVYWSTSRQTYTDAAVRRALAGTLDTLIIGSSHAENGIVPEILDSETGVCSYDLSGWVMPMYAKRLLTEKELGRNPIRTVIIEIAYDTLARSNEHDLCEGDEAVIARLDTVGERLGYMARFLSAEDWVNVASRALYRGGQVVLKTVTGQNDLDPAAKGYYGKPPIDMTLAADKAAEAFHRDTVDTGGYLAANAEELAGLIALCRQHGAEPVLVTLPLSDHFLWVTDGLDECREWLEAFAAEQNCPYVDFNLLRSRYVLFSDAVSFRDMTHLSSVGAEAFTRAAVAIGKEAAAGAEVSDRFYASYADMLRDSPYAAQ